MVKIGFLDENKAPGKSTYPLLKLDQGESARVCLIDSEPEAEFVHTLTMPVIKDGQIVMEERKRANGETYEVASREYVGAHKCEGDFETLKKDQIDPDNCFTCSQVKQFPEFFEPPKRKFAQHVLWYKTKPGSFDVQLPFSGQLVAWVFTENRFNALIDIVKEYGNPQQFDLLLGPCKSKQFQNFEMKAGARCEWLADEARKNFVKELYANNKSDDLGALIARKAAPSQVQIDAEKVKARWSLLGGGGNETFEPGMDTSVSRPTNLGDMLGTSAPSWATEESQTTSSDAPEAASEGEEATEAPAPQEDQSMQPEAKEPAPKGTQSLADILGGL